MVYVHTYRYDRWSWNRMNRIKDEMDLFVQVRPRRISTKESVLRHVFRFPHYFLSIINCINSSSEGRRTCLSLSLIRTPNELKDNNMERYAIGEKLGEGSFGHVFFAVKKSTNEKVRCVHGSFLKTRLSQLCDCRRRYLLYASCVASLSHTIPELLIESHQTPQERHFLGQDCLFARVAMHHSRFSSRKHCPSLRSPPDSICHTILCL